MVLALCCLAASTSLAKTPFLPSSSFPPARLSRRPAAGCRCHYYDHGDDGAFRKNYDHIPKQFREENLKDDHVCIFHAGDDSVRATFYLHAFFLILKLKVKFEGEKQGKVQVVALV